MPLSWQSFKAFFQTIAQAAKSLGAGVKAAYEALKNFVQGVKEEEVEQIMKAAERQLEKPEIVRQYPSDQPLPDELYEESPYAQRRQYYTVARTFLRDRITGEIIDRRLTVTHDFLLSVKDLEDRIKEILARYEEEADLLGWTVEGMYKRPEGWTAGELGLRGYTW